MSSPELLVDHQSVGVIIASCEEPGAFMFQVNDERHPDKRCHGKLQLWGGRMEPEDGADPYAALARELREEWRDQQVAREVARYVSGQHPTSFTLQSSGGTSQPYTYCFHVYFAVVTRRMFMDWFAKLECAGYNEGRMEILTRASVEHYVKDVHKQKLFLGNQHTVLDYYFHFNEILRYLPALSSTAQS